MNTDRLASTVVALGLLKFPGLERTFPGRRGNAGKPYLVDSRGAGANPLLRDAILVALRARLADFVDVQAVAGLAKSGMTWAAWLAQELGLPYATILLDGPREAGLRREIEGDLQGLRVVLVDNWVSSGTSLIQAAEITSRHGGQVAGALVVAGRAVDVGFPLRIAFDSNSLLQEALQQGLISNETFNLIQYQ